MLASPLHCPYSYHGSQGTDHITLQHRDGQCCRVLDQQQGGVGKKMDGAGIKEDEGRRDKAWKWKKYMWNRLAVPKTA